MKKTSHALPFAALAAALALQACTGGSTVPAAVAAAAPASASQANVSERSASGVNLRALPLDDAQYTLSGPKKTWVYSCQAPRPGGGGSNVDGPWIDSAAGTWNMLHKLAVLGAVHWNSLVSIVQGKTDRAIAGNGLPSHATGTFPIAASDPAYAYDQNPNHIAAQHLAWTIPSNPTIAATPSCLNFGAIGVMLTGAQLYDALDAQGRDAAAHEVLDGCNGHPDQSGTYHYHAPSSCMKDGGSGHSALVGYAADGFGIFGVRGTGGRTLSSAQLDACHGHTHAIVWNDKPVVMYHYHLTYDYPYSLGCYRGTPASTGPAPAS